MFSLQLSIILKSDWSIALRSLLSSLQLFILASITQFEDRKTDEEKKIKDTAAVQLQHIMRTHTTIVTRKAFCVSMDSWRERGGKRWGGRWDEIRDIQSERRRERENWRERGSWQTSGCLLFWKPASYPRMCVCVGGWGGRRQRPSEKNIPSAR